MADIPPRTARTSPYELVLGSHFAALHPQLRAYFGLIPLGHIGTGEGVFTVAGAPRRWLRPLIALIVPADVLFPVWEKDVPFTVTNIPGRYDGNPAVSGIRTFAFASGPRVMRDVITAGDEGLIDLLGSGRRFGAAFRAKVDDDALILRSYRMWLRWGARRFCLPSAVAPRISLIERAMGDGTQNVSVTVAVPGIGRIYEYTGTFRYEIVTGE